MEKVELYPVGDQGISVKLGESIDQVTHEKVKALMDYLDANPLLGMIEYIPGFTSVTVFYDPMKLYQPKSEETPYDQMYKQLVAALDQLTFREQRKSRTVEIPVCYGGEWGPDLEELSLYHGLSQEEVIRIHSGTDYLVYMIGFAPGFPYLGGLDERIATPRHQTPRLSIPAGSVGIGGKQTGVYPLQSPGGWQIIGRTPIQLFRPENHPPSLLGAGDRVRFRPISRAQYDAWKEEK